MQKTLQAAQCGDKLELDEMWSFVYRRKNKVWPWLALCRRPRQIVAYALGCRGEATGRVLWTRIPKDYKSSLCYSDFYAAYAQVVPAPQRHRSEKRGHTNHLERYNLTLRQRLGRFVRPTFSISTSDEMHEFAVRLFIAHYKLATQLTSLSHYPNWFSMPKALSISHDVVGSAPSKPRER